MKAAWNQERSDLWRLNTGVPGMGACIFKRDWGPRKRSIFKRDWGPKSRIYSVMVGTRLSDSTSCFGSLGEAKAYAVRVMRVRAKRLMTALA